MNRFFRIFVKDGQGLGKDKFEKLFFRLSLRSPFVIFVS